MAKSKNRCINIDWLEVYCLESNEHYPMNADFYRDNGFFVRERDYGTRQYKEMFVILDKDDLPFLEIRRNPVSGSLASRNRGIFDPRSCHIRVSNRYCYADDIVTRLSEFLMKFDYEVSRLFRLDLCMDFEKFDKGDDPHDVLVRYLKGKYTKINQGNISAHGADRWEGRDWNSLSWGAPTSMVSTKFYNKTLELSEAKDKPYIRYAWMQAGLVDDYVNLTKLNEDGTLYKPVIWRIEFSIRSSARGWYVIEDCTGHKNKTLQKEHTLSTYATKEDQLKAFASLAHYYFHFKKYEEGVRKDRCPDKVLFDFGEHTVYRLDRLMTETPTDRTVEDLAKRLRNFRIVHPEQSVREACDLLLKFIDELKLKGTLPNPYDRTEAKFLQALIARRLHSSEESLAVSIQTVKAVLSLPESIF